MDKHAVNPDGYVGVDGLGRRLPTHAETGGRKERFVGMFYFTWHSYHNHLEPFNISEAIYRCPEAQLDYNHPLWTEQGENKLWFWNEPIFGYYDNEDAWVLRKHAELLADAGVDVVIFDCSNGDRIWPRSYRALAKAWSAARADGVQTPAMSFLLNFGPCEDTATDLRNLHRDYHENPAVRDLWFNWKGKPLVLGYPQSLNLGDPKDREIYEFFTFRPCQPSYFKGPDERGAKWGWLSVCPQAAYPGETGRVEQMAVGCSQNASVESARDKLPSCFSSKEHLFGRNYTQKHGPYPLPEGMLFGKNFEEQWEHALQADPEFIFVTSWNEWFAGRTPDWTNGKTVYPNAMVDTFNDNCSRDIEPTKGILKDHFYYQLVHYVRRYKGMEEPEPAGAPRTIDVAGPLSQWDSVRPEYRTYRNNVSPRECGGYKGCRFSNHTGRNDIVSAKVTHDDGFVYFLVRTAGPLSPAADPAWMRLFIAVEYDTANWEHYQYVLNRVNPGEKAVLERSTGGWNWREAARCAYSIQGDALAVAIPRAALDIRDGAFTLDFKWYDNMQHEGDIMDIYNYGDAAPGGRFNFRYAARL